MSKEKIWHTATREDLSTLLQILQHLQAAERLSASLGAPYLIKTNKERDRVMMNLGSIPRPLWAEIGDAW